MKGLLKFLVFAALVGGAWWGWSEWQANKGLQVEYKTTEIYKDDILITIDATGTLEPEERVDVGAQVGGRIIEFGKDVNGKTVDYSSYVKKDQVLARIDDVLILSDIARAKAGVAQAKAAIAKSEADIMQAKVNHQQALRNRQRAEKLGAGEALSQLSYDQYLSEEEAARASVAAAEAGLAQAKATLESNQATLDKEERNLGYTVIKSPIDGVVIRRVVDIGQTVVASMNAPSLFLLGTDLKKMQIWSAVNEADIASIYTGQKVVFKVDAFPGHEFEGTVNKIRLNATMSSNVVTYIVEIDFENPDRILLPFLTADVKFIVHDLKDTFVVPNSAVRFQPDEDMIVPSEIEGIKKKYAEVAEEELPGRGTRTIPLWVQEGNHVKPVWVISSESNGTVTPIKPAEGYQLQEGMKFVISAQRLSGSGGEEAEQGESKNPFMPNVPRRRKANQTPPPRR